MISRARFITLNLYHILIDGLFDTIPILLAFIVVSFGNGQNGEREIGLIVSFGTAMGTVTGLSTSVFLRRFGFTGSIAVITGSYGICFLAASFAGALPFAGFCFILAVSGHNIFHNISFSYLTTHTERCRLGRIMSDFTAIGDVGRIPLVSFAAFASAYSCLGYAGWRLICFFYGGMALCAALLLFRCSDKNNIRLDKSQSIKNPLFPSLAMLNNKEVLLSMSASVLNALSNDRIFTFLPLFLILKGISTEILGSFAFGFTIGSLVGKMVCGRLVDNFGSRMVFVAAQILLTILLLALIVANSPALIILNALLLGIVTKGTVPIIHTIITEHIQNSNNYEDIFSINSFLRGITNMLTPIFFGFIASVTNMNVVYIIMACTACITILPILLMSKQHS